MRACVYVYIIDLCILIQLIIHNSILRRESIDGVECAAEVGAGQTEAMQDI